MLLTFNRSLFSTFVILISIIYRLVDAEPSIVTSALTPAAPTIELSTNSNISTLDVRTSATSKSSSSSSTTTVIESNQSSSVTTTLTTEAKPLSTTTSSYSPRSGPGLWLLAALLVTIVVVIIAGILFYRHQSSPYRRFLQNWRSRDDDTDNIILQLEQTDSSRGPWPPRISFT